MIPNSPVLSEQRVFVGFYVVHPRPGGTSVRVQSVPVTIAVYVGLQREEKWWHKIREVRQVVR